MGVAKLQIEADLRAEAPPGGEGHAQLVATRSEELVNEGVNRFLEVHAGEPGVQERALRLRSKLGDIALGSYRQADAFERAEGQRYRLETAGRVAAAYGKRAIENPESAEAFYQFGLDSIAERDLPAEAKDGLTQGYRRAFAERFLGVLMQEAPEKVGEAARSELFAGALSPEEIDRLDEQAKLEKGWQEDARRLAQARADRESRERAAMDRDLRLDALEQALETGEADTPDIDRLRQVDGLNQAELGRLKSVARLWKDRQERRVRNIEAITEILNSGGLAGSAQPADREAVEDYYQRWSTSPSLAEASPEERNAALARFVGRVGRLPKALEEGIRDWLDGSPEDQAMVGDLLHRFDGLPQDIPLPISPRTLARARLMRRFETLGHDPATAAKMAQEATQPGDAERDIQRAAEAADLPPITAEEIIEASEHTSAGKNIGPLSGEQKAALGRELVHLPLTPEEKAAIERFAAELQEHEYRLTGDETTARETAINQAMKAVRAGKFDGRENGQGGHPPIPPKRPDSLAVDGEHFEGTAPIPVKWPVELKGEEKALRDTKGLNLLDYAASEGMVDALNAIPDIRNLDGLDERIEQARSAKQQLGRDVGILTKGEIHSWAEQLTDMDPDDAIAAVSRIRERLSKTEYEAFLDQLDQSGSVVAFVFRWNRENRQNPQAETLTREMLAGHQILLRHPERRADSKDVLDTLCAFASGVYADHVGYDIEMQEAIASIMVARGIDPHSGGTFVHGDRLYGLGQHVTQIAKALFGEQLSVKGSKFVARRASQKQSGEKSEASNLPHPAVLTTPPDNLERIPEHLQIPKEPSQNDPEVLGIEVGLLARSQEMPAQVVQIADKSDIKIMSSESLDEYKQRISKLLEYDPYGQHEWIKAIANSQFSGGALLQASKASQIAREKFPDDANWSSKRDAFRHALWSYMATLEIGAENAKKFGDAHERYTEYEPEDMAMDLYNNMIGRILAQKIENKGRDPVKIILAALESGQLIISTKEISNRELKEPKELAYTQSGALYIEGLSR